LNDFAAKAPEKVLKVQGLRNMLTASGKDLPEEDEDDILHKFEVTELI
jgi:hypothetical protein